MWDGYRMHFHCSGGQGGAQDKIDALQKAGVIVTPSPARLGIELKKASRHWRSSLLFFLFAYKYHQAMLEAGLAWHSALLSLVNNNNKIKGARNNSVLYIQFFRQTLSLGRLPIQCRTAHGHIKFGCMHVSSKWLILLSTTKDYYIIFLCGSEILVGENSRSWDNVTWSSSLCPHRFSIAFLKRSGCFWWM